jgi:hypothetical protein
MGPIELPSRLRRFLLDGTDPSVRFCALRDLFGRPENDKDLDLARQAIGKDGWAARILETQQDGGHWETFGGDPAALYLPKYIATNWRLLVLSDLGLTRDDPRIERAASLLLKYWSRESDGSFGGPGSELCITGNSVRMLTRFGFGEDERVVRATDWLVSTQKADGGWHCWPSEKGTLDCWEALAAFASIPLAKRNASVRASVERGANFYLDRGLTRESDGSTYAAWHRLHYPNHYYYDLLVGLDVLTGLGYGSDARLSGPLDELEKKRNPDGTWDLDALQPDLEPGDPYLQWKPERFPYYPFGLEHVRVPSRWITLTALKVLHRCGRL